MSNFEFSKSPQKSFLHKLSIDLISTYKDINKKYYEREQTLKSPKVKNYQLFNSQRISLNSNHGLNKNFNGHTNGIIENEDNSGSIVAKIGDVWNGRYEILSELGSGSFGQVFKCLDRHSQSQIAIKVIKNQPTFIEQAKVEIDILCKIVKFKNIDYSDRVIFLNFSFVMDNKYVSLAFELLYKNMYEVLKERNFVGFSLSKCRIYMTQLTQALCFLSHPFLDIIHCDLKPENIVFVSSNSDHIKIIDFGSSCENGKTIYKYLQSRFYRSPEVLLGLPYDKSIDVWSVGCILFELYSGNPIFRGKNEYDQVMKIVEVVGMPSNKILDVASKTSNFFKKDINGKYHPLHSTYPNDPRFKQQKYMYPTERSIKKLVKFHSSKEYSLRYKEMKQNSTLDSAGFKNAWSSNQEFPNVESIDYSKTHAAVNDELVELSLFLTCALKYNNNMRSTPVEMLRSLFLNYEMMENIKSILNRQKQEDINKRLYNAYLQHKSRQSEKQVKPDMSIINCMDENGRYAMSDMVKYRIN